MFFYSLKFKFRFCQIFQVLEFKKLPTEYKKNNIDQSALLTNEKWPFQISCCRTMSDPCPSREGCPSMLHIFCTLVNSHVYLGLIARKTELLRHGYSSMTPILYNMFRKLLFTTTAFNTNIIFQCPPMPTLTMIFFQPYQTTRGAK